MDKNEIDKTKELLENIYKFDLTIETMQKEIEYWENQKYADKQQYVNALKEEIKKMQDIKLQVSEAINKLSDYFGRVIFTRRYILHKKWNDIAKTINSMSMRNLYYIHDKSMVEFVELLKGDKHDFMESNSMLS